MRRVPLSPFLTRKTNTKKKEANSLSYNNMKIAIREEKSSNLLIHLVAVSRSHRFPACNKRDRKRGRGVMYCTSAGLPVCCTALACICPLVDTGWCINAVLCVLCNFQVAVTGAPPGQDPWGVIEDAHSLGASALLSHVGEKHLWWPTLLQNR